MRFLFATLALTLAGCELYTDGDDDPGVDGGAVLVDATVATPDAAPGCDVDAASLPTCASLGCPDAAFCTSDGRCTCGGMACVFVRDAGVDAP